MIRIEIERKFLVNRLPKDLETCNKIKIKQGYLSYNPEVRIRNSNNKYYLTIKDDGMLARNECEIEISLQVYNELSHSVISNWIYKDRYVISLQNSNCKAELDIYKGESIILHTVEVEFNTYDDCRKFKTPDWFGEEITNKSWYKNKNLARL